MPAFSRALAYIQGNSYLCGLMSSDNFYQRHTGPQKRRRNRALVIDNSNQPPRPAVNADNKPSELARKSLKRFAMVVGSMVVLMYVSVKLIEISWRRSDLERLKQDEETTEVMPAPAVLSKPLTTPAAMAGGETVASPETTNQASALLSRVDPSTIAANKARAEKEFRWGKILEEAGELEGALERYETSLSMNSQDPLILSQVARIYIRQSRHAEAIPLLVKARDLIPDNPDIVNDLGVALTFNGQASDAVILYEKLASSHPEYAPAGFNHGYALVQLSDYEKARPLLEAFLEYEPENAMAIGVLAMLELADDQAEKALELLDRAIEVAPQWATPYLDASGICAARGEHENALAYLEKALVVASPSVVYQQYQSPAFRAIRATDEGLAFEKKIAEQARSAMAP